MVQKHNLIITGDIHYSPIWDKVKSEIKEAINPNDNLRKLLSSLDKKRDILIMNGDLIDYYYSDYLKDSKPIWNEFFSILDSYKINYLCNLGNHDYRLIPYNFTFFPLDKYNINKLKWFKHRKKIGNYKFRGVFREIKSALSSKKTLRGYKFKRNYFKDIDDKRLIFLDTGPDGFTQLKRLHTFRHWLMLFSDHPNSIGLNSSQIRFLKKLLDTDKEVFIFIHSPAFFSRKKIKPIKLNPLNYKISLLYKIGYQKFILKNWTFIKTLLKSKAKIHVISSHTHIKNYYIIDKKNNLLSQSNLNEINRYRKNNNIISFISLSSLASIRKENREIGYIKIDDSKKDKTIREIIIEKF